MKYAEVKTSLEQFMIANWIGTPVESIQFDNVAFNADIFTEYVQFTVRFGEAVKRSLPAKCYRQLGLVIISVKTKPGTGSARKLVLANEASTLLTDQVVLPTPPLLAPKVVLREPTLFDDSRERDGWTMAQVSCPFYYDLEI